MVFSGHEKPNKGATDIWLTPLEIINSLGEFDNDPCGEMFHKTARYIYEKDGLTLPWIGRIWLNPPYSQVSLWLDRLYESTRSEGLTGVALVSARTDTKWFQKHIRLCSHAFLPAGRISFLTKDLQKKGNAGAPSVFLSYKELPNWDNLPMKGFVIK